MTSQLVPFNLDLLILDGNNSKLLQPITVLDIMDGATKNFHRYGLFSTEIFGKYGEERRNRAFAYIDFKVEVFHPVIFKALSDLKSLYAGIMAGTDYSVWDNTIKDFVASTPLDGRTGFAFFFEHWTDIKFEVRPSTKREYNIKLVNKFKEKAILTKVLVMPAGLRDYEIDEQGKPSEDEINTLYRKFISFSNLITPAAIKVNPESINQLRYNIQNNFNELYDYIKALLEGKKKLILGKFASRKIINGTRNVITSLNNDTDELNSPTVVSYNQTMVGLYQYLKATLPVTIFQLKDYFLYKVFVDNNGKAMLVNKKTLRSEMVDIDPDYFDDWMSTEGLEKTISGFGVEESRHNAIEIHGYYLGLIYKGPDRTYKLIQSIDELPPGRSVDDVHPLTYTELFYLSVCRHASKYPAVTTRYPIAGIGSIYPTFMYLKPTIKVEVRTELNDQWELSDYTTYNFPCYQSAFVNSMSPHSAHLKRLTADFDGDMMSLTVSYSEESIAEVKKKLNSRNYYVDHNNKIMFSASTDTINQVLQSITG